MLSTNGSTSKDVAQWINWTHFFAIGDEVAHLIYTLIASGKIPITDDALKKGLLASLIGLHVALKDVDNAFIAVIDSIKQGQTPGLVLTSAPLPDWDEDPKNQPLELVKSSWESIKPVILLWMQQLQGKKESPEIEKVIIAFSALVNASDSIINAIAKVLNQK